MHLYLTTGPHQAKFLKGCSGNPGGRPKVEGDVRELAREHGPDAIRRLVQLMHSPNERVAVAACAAILDRAYGRAAQAVRMDAEVGFQGSGLIALLASLPRSDPPPKLAQNGNETRDLADQRQAQVDDR